MPGLPLSSEGKEEYRARAGSWKTRRDRSLLGAFHSGWGIILAGELV